MNKIDIRGTTSVVREQVIEIKLADLDIESGIDTVKVVIIADNGMDRPRSRTVTIPQYMLGV